MTHIIVNEREKPMVHILIVLIELLHIQFFLLTIWHRMEFLDILKKLLLIESINILDLDESECCHLFVDLSHNILFSIIHVYGG